MNRGSYLFSAGFHAAVIAVAFLGLPSLFQKEIPEPQPIVVSIVNLADQTKATETKQPFYGGKCYACDAKAVGLCDRRKHYVEDALVPACERHADPTVKCYEACFYCNGQARKGSLDIEGNFAHAKCHREASK